MIEPPVKIGRKLDSLPSKPGVYMWLDDEGNVIYVGKAKSLRSRVRNYFRSGGRSIKDTALLEFMDDIETIVVPSEAEALLLENNLIKEHRPKFNIALRDDKSYPSIAVTLGEDYPRVLVVRRLNIPGARYFGPYTDVAIMRRMLRVIRRIFTVRSCHYDLMRETPDRPCLDYHIHRCMAPCVAYQSREEYRAMIDDVIRFLEGKTVEVRRRLRERMEEASARMEYERAAELRNSIRWLEQLEEPQTVQVVGGGHSDAVGMARDGNDAVGVLVRIRNGKFVGREQQFLENVADESDASILSAFLVRHYLGAELPARKLLLPSEPSDMDEFVELAKPVKVLIPRRGMNRKLVELAEQNARHLMESFRIESFEADERSEDPVYALGRDLGLRVVPRSMACIDISTSQGRDTVGSLVWFEAGRPRKSEYRRFKIRGEQQDDYAAIAEVVERYVTRRVDEEKDLPDLVLIDGGRGQLSAARKVARNLDADIELASIAKKEEEVFRPGISSPIRLSRRSPSLRLLQRIRNEAHRFAVEYNRKTRQKRTFESELMSIPGIGPTRRRRLLERFGSLAGVKLATVDEIASVPGFSKDTARTVLDYLEEQ